MAESQRIQRFEATPRERSGGLFIDVPFDVEEAFGMLRPPVRVTLGKHTFSATISSFQGRSYLTVPPEHREASGVEPGKPVKVAVQFDEDQRPLTPPAELKAAIRGKKGLLAGWDKFTQAEKREAIRAIAEAKDDAARAAEVSRVVSRLASRR